MLRHSYEHKYSVVKKNGLVINWYQFLVLCSATGILVASNAPHRSVAVPVVVTGKSVVDDAFGPMMDLEYTDPKPKSKPKKRKKVANPELQAVDETRESRQEERPHNQPIALVAELHTKAIEHRQEQTRPEPQTAFEAQFYAAVDDSNILGPVVKSREPSQHDLPGQGREALGTQHVEHPCAVPVECDRQITLVVVAMSSIDAGVEPEKKELVDGTEQLGQVSLHCENLSRMDGNSSGQVAPEERTCCQSLWAILTCQSCRK